MSLHDRIREARNLKGISQSQFAKLLGVAPSTAGGWENSPREPTAAQLGVISEVLEVPVDFLLQDEIKDYSRGLNAPTAHEMEIIKRYRLLDDDGKAFVETVIQRELRRCDSVQEEPKKLYSLTVLNQSAAAGIGFMEEDFGTEVVDLMKSPPPLTTFGIYASGDSMEPTIHDGDLLFVREAVEIPIGKIGIFLVEGSVYVKERGKEGLISHNRKYGLITPANSGDIICRGLVLGVADESYFR